MNAMRACATTLLATFCLGVATPADAEQVFSIGDVEVHYIVVPTTFLRPQIANEYDLVRGRDRALVNISVLGPDGRAQSASITGTTRNLLGQSQTLEFRQITEGPAIYYLAQIRHADEEHHRIELTITLGNGRSERLAFQQKLYWEE